MTEKQVLRQAKKDGYEDPDMVLFLYNNAFIDTKENPRPQGHLEPINLRERIIAMLDDMKDRTQLSGPLYGRIVGAYGNHKLKLFGLENYNKRAFTRAWKAHPLISKLTCSNTWCDLGGSNSHLYTGYGYKLYISVILDGTPESINEFSNIFGSVLKSVLRPFQSNPNDNVQIKFANHETIMDHFDTIVLYSLSEDVINEMKGILEEKIPEWNEKIQHCRILTPQERAQFFVRTTIGADGPNHSDSSALEKVIIDKYYQRRHPFSRNEFYDLLKNWVTMPPSEKLMIYRNWNTRKRNPRPERLPGRNLGYGTNNGGMAKNQLRTIKRTSIELHDAIRDADELPDWVLSKITVAQDRLTVATDYILSKLRKMELEAQGYKMNPFIDEDPLYVQDEVDYAKDVIEDIGMAKMRKAQEKLDRLIYVYAPLINAVDIRKMRRINHGILKAIQSGKVREDLLKKAKHFTDQFYVVDEEFSSEDSWEEEYSSEE
jgi:hypothetical protein